MVVGAQPRLSLAVKSGSGIGRERVRDERKPKDLRGGRQAAAGARGYDPAVVPEAGGESVLARAGQALVYATRSYLRGTDGAELEVRSNPLLVTVYGEESPP